MRRHGECGAPNAERLSLRGASKQFGAAEFSSSETDDALSCVIVESRSALVLPADTKAQLRQLRAIIEDPEAARRFGVDPPSGLLLASPRSSARPSDGPGRRATRAQPDDDADGEVAQLWSEHKRRGGTFSEEQREAYLAALRERNAPTASVRGHRPDWLSVLRGTGPFSPWSKMKRIG